MIPVGEWLPDLPTLQNPGALEARNVIPALNSYRPLPSFVEAANAMSARVQGAVLARGVGGTIAQFAGDATKLYRLNISGTSWADVSRTSGGPYATPADGGWSFAQFGDLVIATNGIDAPQKFTIGSSSNFTALGGSPPTSRFAATVRDFVFLARVSSLGNRVQWSGINNAETWASSQATQADFQDLPDGGLVMGGVGGEYGLIFQERAIKRATYVNVPAIFQFDEISRGIGTPAEGSIARYEGTAFFLSDDGFFAVVGGAELQPIGRDKVDRFFWSDINQTYLNRITSAVDPINKLYVVAYPSRASVDGTSDRLLIYNWSVARWSRAEVTLEMVHQAASQAGFTLDQLNTVSASLDALPFSLDSRIWTGVGRLLLAGFSPAHRIGFFGGPSMAATIDTAEAQIAPGRRALVRGLRPLVDGGNPSVRIGVRDVVSKEVSFGPAAAMADHGACPVRASGRYHRARIEIPAGADWTHVQGIDEVQAAVAGAR